MPDGPAQQKRDEKMAQRMDKANPKYEYWKAGGGLEWLYGYDFLKEVSFTPPNMLEKLGAEIVGH